MQTILIDQHARGQTSLRLNALHFDNDLIGFFHRVSKLFVRIHVTIAVLRNLEHLGFMALLLNHIENILKCRCLHTKEIRHFNNKRIVMHIFDGYCHTGNNGKAVKSTRRVLHKGRKVKGE